MNKQRQKNKGGHCSANAPIVFKRWTRTHYGMFSSIRKVVKIGVLGTAMSIITSTTMGYAQSSDTLTRQKVLELETAEVLEFKQSPTNATTLPIVIFNTTTEQHAPLSTIEDALKLSPSVDLRERGTKGVQADISIRGGSFDQTMILLNGIDFSDSRTGHQSHSLPIDLQITNNIELITDVPLVGALTGALNFSTSPFKNNSLKANIEMGSYGYGYVNWAGSYTKNNLSALAAVSYRRSDGYIDNTDFQTLNAYSRLMYETTKAGFFDFQIGYQNKAFGANSFYSTAYPNQFEATRTALTSITWKKNINKFSIGSSVGYRRNNDHYELFRDNINAPSWYTGHNNHFTDNIIVSLKGDYNWKFGKSSIGVDYTASYLESNVLGKRTRNVVNAWGRQTAHIHKLSLLGAFTISTSYYGISPLWSIAGGYTPTKNWNIVLNINRSMRLPTFTDLYYTTATHIANHNLKPETAITYQATVEYKYKGFFISITPYFRQGQNLIDWVKLPDAEKWESQQLTELNTLGLEVLIGYRSKGVLQNISLGYGYINTNKNSHGYISQYPLDYVKNKLVSSFTLKIVHNLYLSTIGTMYDRNGSYQIANNKQAKYTPYFIIDSRLSWEPKSVKLYVELNNILNQTYYDIGGIIQPGLWITAGIEIQISK